ncbi:N-acetyl-D-Glu racemase DgcA [Celerinatantimonas sp. YJH-8]|uniref:N-acetyl-D-Glu racemase DgcA n=1 Tax=Celerinatantimonas sp. YJH-8 TaxID=3228714 RepID=UPI0038C42C91
MQLRIYQQSWPIAGAFTISRGSRTEARIVLVELLESGFTGRGECVPYTRYGETIESVTTQISNLSEKINQGMTRQELNELLPAGAARNALDCALWDLECKRKGCSIWSLLDIEPHSVTSAYTLSLDTPEKMHEKAVEHQHRPLLKLKLAGKGDLERVQAVRQGSPQARIIVDANEGWTPEIYQELIPELVKLNVEMIEQPLPADQDSILSEFEHPITLCADESCHTRKDLHRLKGRYEMINIKIDKTGGLTEALELKAQAEQSGFKIMVGCMLGTSLSMAPAFTLAQSAHIVDLDGPLLLAEDRPNGFSYTTASEMQLLKPQLWG